MSMPILLPKELLWFYHDHSSNMYVCFLDASKAFDHTDNPILFSKQVVTLLMTLSVYYWTGPDNIMLEFHRIVSCLIYFVCLQSMNTGCRLKHGY